MKLWNWRKVLPHPDDYELRKDQGTQTQGDLPRSPKATLAIENHFSQMQSSDLNGPSNAIPHRFLVRSQKVRMAAQ